MTIVRREHRAQFTIIPNAIFRNDRLSIEAKGVLGYLLSRPHNWQVRLDHVGRTLRIGRKKLTMAALLLSVIAYIPIYKGMQAAAGNNVLTVSSVKDKVTGSH